MLPCCPFDFTAKYQRRNAADSVFRDYLNFVREVGGVAGFTVQEDKMRIPSTKRICLVGEPEEKEGAEGQSGGSNLSHGGRIRSEHPDPKFL